MKKLGAFLVCLLIMQVANTLVAEFIVRTFGTSRLLVAISIIVAGILIAILTLKLLDKLTD